MMKRHYSFFIGSLRTPVMQGGCRSAIYEYQGNEFVFRYRHPGWGGFAEGLGGQAPNPGPYSTGWS